MIYILSWEAKSIKNSIKVTTYVHLKLTKIQGFFKDLHRNLWNSRTFQGLPLKFKDFSRLFEHWGVFHDFPVQEFSIKLAQHFLFLSVNPQPFMFILPYHASPYLRVFLAEVGVSNAVLVSLSSDDCFNFLQRS